MAYHQTFKMMICLLIYIYLKEIARTPKTDKKNNSTKMSTLCTKPRAILQG